MVRRNYDALVSGDGACAGCGEKSILRACAAVTEAYMRPLYHAKADRLRAKADQLDKDGVQNLAALKARNQDEYDLLRQAVAHMLMGLGGEDDKDTKARMAAHGPISDRDVIDAITAVMRKASHKIQHRRPAARNVGDGDGGQRAQYVYGSTQPNPAPSPWMTRSSRTAHRRLAPRQTHLDTAPVGIPERLAMPDAPERSHDPARYTIGPLHGRGNDRLEISSCRRWGVSAAPAAWATIGSRTVEVIRQNRRTQGGHARSRSTQHRGQTPPRRRCWAARHDRVGAATPGKTRDDDGSREFWPDTDTIYRSISTPMPQLYRRSSTDRVRAGVPPCSPLSRERRGDDMALTQHSACETPAGRRNRVNPSRENTRGARPQGDPRSNGLVRGESQSPTALSVYRAQWCAPRRGSETFEDFRSSRGQGQPHPLRTCGKNNQQEVVSRWYLWRPRSFVPDFVFT